MPKISELTGQSTPFNSTRIEIIKPSNNYAVSMKSVFDWIKEQAQQDEGLIIEYTGESIIFIKGKNSNK